MSDDTEKTYPFHLTEADIELAKRLEAEKDSDTPPEPQSLAGDFHLTEADRQLAKDLARSDDGPTQPGTEDEPGAPEDPGPLSEDSSKQRLVDAARELNLDTSGTKADIFKRIQDHQNS